MVNKHSRTSAVRFRVGEAITNGGGSDPRHASIASMMLLQSHGDEVRIQPERAGASQAAYLAMHTPEKKFGQGAKYEGDVPKDNLLRRLAPEQRDKMIRAAIKKTGVKEAQYDSAFSDALFALLRTEWYEGMKTYGAAAMVIKRAIYKTKRDEGAPVKVPDDKFSGEGREAIYEESVEDLANMLTAPPVGADTGGAEADLSLELLSPRGRQMLLAVMAELPPKSHPLVMFMLRGESMTRAAELANIKPQQLESHKRRIAEAFKKYEASLSEIVLPVPPPSGSPTGGAPQGAVLA